MSGFKICTGCILTASRSLDESSMQSWALPPPCPDIDLVPTSGISGKWIQENFRDSGLGFDSSMSTPSPHTTSDHLQTSLAQMRAHDLHCPFLWLSEQRFRAIHEEGVHHMLMLHSSVWEELILHILLLSRDMLLNKVNVSEVGDRMDVCFTLLADGQRSFCPLILEYHSSLEHVLQSTWVVIASLLMRCDVTSVHTFNSIPKLRDLTAKEQSGVMAVRAFVMRASYYGAIFFKSGRKTHVSGFLYDFLRFAERAYELHPLEGTWATLFGSALPRTDCRKSNLLDAGFMARRTPYTSMEYATHLVFRTPSPVEVTLSAMICEAALRDWPHSLHVNMGYILLFLRTSCQKRLRSRVAARCLTRLLDTNPDSILLQNLAQDLKKHVNWSFRRHSRRYLRLSLGFLPQIIEEEDEPEQKHEKITIGNCVCTSICAHRTYKVYGTLRPHNVFQRCWLNRS